ncbi:MAG: PmoA family protein [Isosphaeraceae bacterium]
MKPPRTVFEFPRVQATPGIDRCGFGRDGREQVGYEFGTGGPRPFLFPLIGPSGLPVTRMGHPNPVGHEHHRSVWLGHQDVGGVNFWEEKGGVDVKIRHRRVTAYRDSSDWSAMVAELDWWANGRSMLQQRLIVAFEPRDDGGFALDLDCRFEAVQGAVDLGKTNFGFLGVRVSKTISARFGGGRLLADDGAEGEPSIFGKRHRWLDYSGPVTPGKVEGISYLDHPENPRHPSHWHVRDDGWMAASFNLSEGFGIAPGHPLDLRYRLRVHEGPPSAPAIEAEWKAFADSRAFEPFADPKTRLPGVRRSATS